MMVFDLAAPNVGMVRELAPGRAKGVGDGHVRVFVVDATRRDLATRDGQIDLDLEVVALLVMVVGLFDDDRAALDAPVHVLEAGGPALDRRRDGRAWSHVAKRDV